MNLPELETTTTDQQIRNTTMTKPKTHKKLELAPLLDILSDSRLSWSHKVVLTYLSMLPRGKEVTAPEIEAVIPMSHQTVHASVLRLHSLGLIVRHLTDHPKSLTRASATFSVAPDFRSKLVVSNTPAISEASDAGDIDQLIVDATPVPYEPRIPLRSLDDLLSPADIAGDDSHNTDWLDDVFSATSALGDDAGENAER